jgi:hypothetical protein
MNITSNNNICNIGVAVNYHPNQYLKPLDQLTGRCLILLPNLSDQAQIQILWMNAQ